MDLIKKFMETHNIEERIRRCCLRYGNSVKITLDSEPTDDVKKLLEKEGYGTVRFRDYFPNLENFSIYNHYMGELHRIVSAINVDLKSTYKVGGTYAEGDMGTFLTLEELKMAEEQLNKRMAVPCDINLTEGNVHYKNHLSFRNKILDF